MRHNKFFNANLNDDLVKSNNKVKNTNIKDISSYIFLTVLGIVCVIGLVYYIVEYFSTK